MRPARLLPGAVLLFLVMAGGFLAYRMADVVGPVPSILVYWLFLCLLAVGLLGLGLLVGAENDRADMD